MNHLFQTISPETWRNIRRLIVHPTTQLVHSASSEKLNIAEEVPCIVSKGTLITNATVYLANNPAPDLLGLDHMETLKLADHSVNNICRRI